ncbi:MAG: FecR domain-containing protein, partial [Verrucomicrobiota bacterium]
MRLPRIKSSSLIALNLVLLLICPVQAELLKEAQVTRIVNDVDLIESSDTRRNAKINDTMRDDMVLATGHKSRAELRFTDETLARIGANSFFTFTEGTRNMELGKGTMLLKVPKGAGGAKVSTQSVTAAITGTTVLLETNPGGPVVLHTDNLVPTPEADEDLRAQGLGRYVNPSIYNSMGRSVPKAPKMWAANAQAAPQSMHVSAVSGSAFVMRPGELDSVPLNPGDDVPVGSYVFTQGDGEVTLNPVKGVATRITADSTVRVNALERRINVRPKVEFELKEGSILSALGPEDARKIDYRIKTTQGIVAARGTVIGTTAQNGQTGVFGGHGTITFSFDGREEVITPGKFKNFIGQGGNVQMGTDLPTNSPQFQSMMQQTLQLVQQAANQGLIRPGLPNDVRSALQNAGVPVPPPASTQPNNPNTADSSAGNGNNAPVSQPVARRTPSNDSGGINVGGNNQKGFSKMIVLEGKMRVYLNDRLGESMVIEPGQMIILNPNANRLPQPVNVDLNRLTRTSGLINGFKKNQPPGEDGLTVQQDNAGNTILKDPKVLASLKDQKKKLDNGDLQPTGLAVNKNRLQPAPREKPPLDKLPQSGPGGGGDSAQLFNNPGINPGTFTVNDSTRILGAPPKIIVGGSTINGSIYRAASGQPLADFAFFNGLQNIDLIISDGDGGPANPLEKDASIFKFERLNIDGNPNVFQTSINTIFGATEPSILGLIGFDDVSFRGTYNGTQNGINKPDETFIVSENGGINIVNTNLNDFENNLIYYARNGGITIQDLDIKSPSGIFSFNAKENITINNPTPTTPPPYQIRADRFG